MKHPDELESGEHVSPNIQNEDAEPSPLQTYLAYLKDKRQAQERWLKSHGMTWTKLEELETEAIAEMQALGQDGINIDGYRAILVDSPIKAFPLNTVKIIGHSYRISLHSRR